MHDYKIIECGEWFDIYKCTKCKNEVCTEPEDLMTVKELNERDNFQCNEGKEDGKV